MLEAEDKVRSQALTGHVGFDSLPDQLVNKSVKSGSGFIFNILCIGETGLGKSTLMDSLFNTSFGSLSSPHNCSEVKLKSHLYELQESNVHLKLSIIETVGYGDQINKQDSFKPVVDYVDAQFEAYLQEELKLKRSLSVYHDTRVHSCLYFICPTGHGLKSIDLACMKKLDSKINIIPIIAKADTIPKAELQKFKDKINAELASNEVKVYQFPTDDDTVAEINTTMNTHIPFAVVGSSDFVRVGNKMMRARQYPWGTVQVENETHCDFVKLREMLIRTNMEDMREQTHLKHYELYRKTRLQQELQQEEVEMKQKFIQKVKDKEEQLKEAETELHEKFEQMKEDYTKERKKLEEHLKMVEDETAEFYKLTDQHAQRSTTSSLWSGSLGKGKKK